MPVSHRQEISQKVLRCHKLNPCSCIPFARLKVLDQPFSETVSPVSEIRLACMSNDAYLVMCTSCPSRFEEELPFRSGARTKSCGPKSRSRSLRLNASRVRTCATCCDAKSRMSVTSANCEVYLHTSHVACLQRSLKLALDRLFRLCLLICHDGEAYEKSCS
jgi:hypothetical protein